MEASAQVQAVWDGRRRRDGQERDAQTNRQTDKKLNTLPLPRRMRANCDLGMLLEDLEHVLVPRKRLMSDARFRC